MSENEEKSSAASDKLVTAESNADKEHLAEVNRQLQQTVDTLRGQLRDAMEAANAINGMNDTISQLRNELNDEREKERQLNKEIKRLEDESEECHQKYSQDVAALSQQIEQANQKAATEAEKSNKLKKEKKELKAELDEKSSGLENLAIELKDAKTSKKKLRAKFIEAAEKVQEYEKENSQLRAKIQDSENVANTLTQDIEALKVQLSTVESAKQECEATISQLKRDVEKKVGIITTFEEQFESQRNEMEETTTERQNILLLVQKMHSALAAAEIKVEALKKENSDLKTKLTKAGRKTNICTGGDFTSLSIPFEGEIGQKADLYMKMPQYQPVQRLQLVLNEAAKHMKETEDALALKEEQCANLQNQLDQAVSGQTPYCQILDTLLKELKDISVKEAQINNANLCRVDTDFIEYMAQKSAELEPLIRDELLKDPRFIPSDFFTTADVNKKIEYIKEIIKCSDVSYTIFTAQFLTNQLLINQLNALMGPLGKMEEISRLDVVGGDFNDIPNLLKSLQDKINRLKKTRTQLHALLKKEKETSNNLAKSENDLKTQCAQLQMTNESLQSEVDVLKVKYQVASNELLLKSNAENLNEFANHLRDNLDEQQQEAKQRTDRLEAELEQKTKECSELSELIKKLQITLQESTKKQSKRYQKTEDALKTQIAEMQQQIEVLEKQITQKKKLAKRNERSLREQYDASIQEVSQHYEESKASLLKTIEDLKQKAAEAREMTKKLQQNCTESEDKNAKLTNENADLIAEKKNLNAQLMSIKQQIQKDKQHLQVQLAAQQMACESKVQTATQEVKAQEEKHVKDLLDIVGNSLGQWYGVDDDFTEEMLKQVVSHAREDLERLQYFQKEATKL